MSSEIMRLGEDIGEYIDKNGKINGRTVLLGGFLAILFSAIRAARGIAMGMFLPPHYIVPFGLGGIIRGYTDKVYGKKFYDERGRLIVTGLMASSLIVQVIMTIIVNFF